jgi:uncharacterized protein YjlB
MSAVQGIKRLAEKVTGVGWPSLMEAAALVQPRRPRLLLFADDGKTPNNPRCPMLLYRSAVGFRRHLDPAAVFEQVFAGNGWEESWRDGIFDFLHFHTRTHEVLGIARGQVRVRFGGAKGRTVTLRTGDVVVLPAGTGHQRVSPGNDLLVVGAYPPGGDYDQPQPGEIDHRNAVADIARVVTPKSHPLYGEQEPLTIFW